MADHVYTLRIGNETRVIRSPRPLSDSELREIAEQLRTGGVRRQVLPRETQQARDLAALLSDHPATRGLAGKSLYDAVKRYAPSGMGEDEVRWAALEIERRRARRGILSTLADIFLRPETAHPSYDPAIQPPRRIGILEGLGNLLGTPLRALSTTILSRFAKGRQFGRETGTPTQVGSWAETYAGDPNWGSVLEALAPGVPASVRQPLGVLSNIALDPLALLQGLGVVGRGASALKASERIASAAQRVAKGAEKVERALSSVPKGWAAQAMQKAAQKAAQTAQKAAQAVARTAQTPIPSLSMLDRPASENLARWLGINPLTAQFSASPLRAIGLALHFALDPVATTRALQAAKEAPKGERLSQLFEELANVAALRQRAARGEAPQALLREYHERGRLYAPDIPDAPVSAEERKIAHQLALKYHDVEGLAEQYLQQYGHRIDPDAAKELIEEYGKGNKAQRAYYSPLVHPISSAVAWRAYERALQNPETEQVVLIMGASGAGKTTVISKLIEQGRLAPNSIIHDRSFTGEGDLERAITLAQQAGKPIQIIYVDTPERLVLQNVIRRAFETGRTPSLDYVVDTIFAARERAKQLYRRYRNTPQIELIAFRNTAQGVREVPFRQVMQYATPSDAYRDRVKYLARRDLNDYLAAAQAASQRASHGERAIILARLTGRVPDHSGRIAGVPRGAERTRGHPRTPDHEGTSGDLAGGEATRRTEAVAAEAERLIRLQQEHPSFYSRALSLWKATKTTLNPPSFVRNFLQNFVLRFIEGEPVERVPLAVYQLLRDPERFRALWRATAPSREAVQEAQQQAGLLKRVMELAARGYEGADRLAAVLLAQASGKRPESFLMNYAEIPRTLEFLRRTGIAPFIAWQYFAIPAVARGVVDYPSRARAVLQALSGLQPNPDKRGAYVQVGSKEIRTGTLLPLNPAEFGGEMPLVDIRQIPLLQLGKGLESTLTGQGRPWPMQEGSTSNRLIDTVLFLKDFFAPPALGYYLPGVIAPPKAESGKRLPRGRIDYLLGLLGISTRPVDPLADARQNLRQTSRELSEQRK